MLKALAYAVLLIAFLAGPAALVSYLLRTHFNATLFTCNPQYGVMGRSDEMHYWTEIDCFRAVGFDGGYFLVNEKPAPARWTHFGPHGPGFPAVYGSVARLARWELGSVAVFNVGFLIVGSIAWLLLVRPTLEQLAAAVLVVMTFWPCLVYIPATLQESFQCAVAFALAGLVHRKINGTETRLWPLLLLASAASLVRITWALLLLAWAIAAGSATSRRSRVLAFLAVPALILVWRYIAAPYPNSLEAVLATAREQPLAACERYFTHVGRNLYTMFSTFFQPFSSLYQPSQLIAFHQTLDQPLQMVERYQLTILVYAAALIGLRLHRSTRPLAAFLVIATALMLAIRTGTDAIVGSAITILGFWLYRGRLKRPYLAALACAAILGLLVVLHVDDVLRAFLGRVRVFATQFMLLATLCLIHREFIADGLRRFLAPWFPVPAAPRPYLFAGLNVALVAVVILGLYDVKYDRDFRVLAPHLLVSLLLLITGSAYRFGLGLAAIALLAAPVFDVAFEEQHHKRFVAVGEVDLRPYLAYDGTKSPWDNTLLVSDMTLQPNVRVPAGIGVSTLVENEDTWGVPVERRRVLSAPKSRYLFMPADEAAASKGCHLKLLHETRHGNLYLNLDNPAD
jgi:hypothetical protein